MNASLNNKSQKTTLDNENFYFEHIKRWQDSGLSRNQYCQKNNINYPAFKYWRSKQLKGATKKALASAPSFTPLTINTLVSNQSVSMTVVLPNGIKLLIPTETAPHHMIELIRKLGEGL